MPRRVSVTITIPGPLLRMVEEEAERLGLTRSAVITMILAQHLHAIEREESK